MKEFFDLIPIPGKGTFFCTQFYDVLNNSKHESGPHPFLPAEQGGWDKELNKMREMLPKAVGWRSHSCVISHPLTVWLKDNGYVYTSTYDQFLEDDIRPHRHAWGVWQVPIYYMDNMDFSYGEMHNQLDYQAFNISILEKSVSNDSLYVFDFHPIHLMLNTPNSTYYSDNKDLFQKNINIEELVYRGRGVRTFYLELLDLMNGKSMKSYSIREMLNFKS
nr:hypothetical protein [Candidatus Terasakiella magnetica]